MSFNTKNYQETCDKLVIGGALEIAEGATLTGFPSCDSPATESALGGIKAAQRDSEDDTVEIKIDSTSAKLYAPSYPETLVAENQVDSTAATIADLKTDFNGLLAKLKTAGLMEADS